MRWFTIILICVAGLAQAESVAYRLDGTKSKVAFDYLFEGQSKTGIMPVSDADIWLDLDNLPSSRVDVTLNAAAAQAGFAFATQAMKSPQVLNTRAYPTIRFRSTRLTGGLSGATVKGQLTVRGVTRPVTLKARLYRQSGTNQGERNKLAVLLTGEIDRNAFGATGYPGYVGPKIGLRVLALIVRR